MTTANECKILPDSSWQEELSNKITDLKRLENVLDLSAEQKREISSVIQVFKLGITPFYFSLMDKNDPNCPIRKQAIPSIKELDFHMEELDDPIGDNVNSPVVGLTHRYPDRVLIYPTYECATYCRHCFRRKIVGHYDGCLSQIKIENILDYIRLHKKIKEVILTGGDPLILDDYKLKDLLLKIKSIKHVRILRIHTRVFVALPHRITGDLVEILKLVKPMYIIVHVNHLKEISVPFKQAIQKVSEAGIPIFSQSVLLKGINDDVQSLRDLFYGLIESGVKPYYLHHCDLARGVHHFRTSIQKGVDLLRQLRGFVSGLCIPYYMVETTGGRGKVPMIHNYVKYCDETKIDIENYDGEVYRHHHC